VQHELRPKSKYTIGTYSLSRASNMKHITTHKFTVCGLLRRENSERKYECIRKNNAVEQGVLTKARNRLGTPGRGGGQRVFWGGPNFTL